MELKTVILAAGMGTRMKSELPKVLHEIDKKPLAQYVREAALGAGAGSVCYVVGYKRDMVKERLKDEGVSFAVQDKQLGTAHAVKCARDYIGNTGDVMILCGDTPLVSAHTLKKAVEHHRAQGNSVTVLSAVLEDPSGYGRIIRDENGSFLKSVEHKDASEEELKVREVNAGIYVFDAASLIEALDLIKNDNAQGEYYLPDALGIILSKGKKADAFVIEDTDEILGVNDREQLKVAADIIAKRKAQNV